MPAPGMGGLASAARRAFLAALCLAEIGAGAGAADPEVRQSRCDAGGRKPSMYASALLQTVAPSINSTVVSAEGPGLDAAARSTVGLFTRIIEQEFPHLASFVNHYIGLGVQDFYFLTNQKRQLGRIGQFLDKLAGSRASYQLFYREGGADDVLNASGLLESISQDYVICVDVDEFWVPPPGIQSFRAFLASNSADVYYANWSLVPNDGEQELGPPYRGVVMHHGKYIARTSMLRSLRGIHVPAIRRDVLVPANASGGTLVHFWGRSFTDVAMKGVAQFFRDGSVFPIHETGNGTQHGCEGLSRTLEMLRWGGVPERMQVLAFLSLLPRPQAIDWNMKMLEVDHALQDDMATRIFRTNITEVRSILHHLHGSYDHFKACVRHRMQKGLISADFNPDAVSKWLQTLNCSRPL